MPLKGQCQANLDKVKLNHISREEDIEGPLQLASGGVDDAHTPLVEGEALGEDPEIDIDLGASSEEKVVVEFENI